LHPPLSSHFSSRSCTIKNMTANPFTALRRLTLKAALFAAAALLFGIFAVMYGLAGDLISAMQHEIFSLLFLQLYQFEITKNMVRKVSRK